LALAQTDLHLALTLFFQFTPMDTRTYCLLIDNDEDDRELFALALSELELPIACRSVASGEEALLILDDESTPLPDFIFIDMNMPGMDGPDCLGALREKPRLATIPIYMYSTAADPRIVSGLKGIAGFIEKPTRFAGLREVLESIINTHRV
jgi:CheY-like chemotaxis protein